MDINGYLNEIRSLASSGKATEHSYRPALERLFRSIDDGLTVINEPRRLTDVGAPDFVFDRNGVSMGWCEAKDLFKEITRFRTGDYSKEQKARYAKGLPNLIYTNGTDFEFIVKGEVTGFVSIADLIPTLPARPAEFPRLEMLLKDFASQTPISINTAKQLAEMMAGKAVIIKDIMGNALVADIKTNENTDLVGQYQAFKTHLIHDITVAEFADIYAETIAYGLFAARLHDTDSLDTFDRAEALVLLPRSNPFLRNLFVYIAGPNLDERLKRMIDDLCEVFRACDLPTLMQDFGKWTARNDPFLHFYETFLAEYNPAKRKARGVWYTPEPVVNFIVRAVDDVLKTEFGLSKGLADTSKVTIDWDSGQDDLKSGKRVTTKREVHRVQILDPATGTGTFLAEAIKQIAAQVKDVAPAMWSSYVERDLIPRLHGFELLMASYAMCHMKLDMMLTDMGYKPSAAAPRLGVYLTNSLEEGERVEQTLFGLARDITEEGRKASEIKNDMPIMCVIGNPPYSGISQNMGSWIVNQIEDYKYVDDVHFGERKHWLHDDYVKFLRLAEHMIEKNGEGVLGFITNHGYLDNPTFRGMRWHLLQTFDKIYILDLHGNMKKRELSPDGTADKNVFDIQSGVAVIVGVKKQRLEAQKNKGEKTVARLADLYHADLWGTRDAKNLALWSFGLGGSNWQRVTPAGPFFTFVDRDAGAEVNFNAGFSLSELMATNVTGIVSARDSLVVDFDRTALSKKIELFRDPSKTDADTRFEFFGADKPGQKYAPGDSRGWKLQDARKSISTAVVEHDIRSVSYRPFDTRAVYYRPDMVDWGRQAIMPHFFRGRNCGLSIGRQGHVVGGMPWNLTLIHEELSDFNLFYRGGVLTFPLYLYPEEGTFETERRVNFDPKLYAEIRERAGLSGADGDELKVFDYIYGVLHSPDYRATYAQFLKIDFPRIPYPASPQVFAHVAEKGGQLRRLHLMEDAAIGATPYPFKGDGDNVVVKPAYAESSQSTSDGEGDRAKRGGGAPPSVASATATSPSQVDGEGLIGRVMINPDQYFEHVPAVAWEFHIGGYQPAQKWLKDRKGRALSFDDVMHYQKIIKILTETDRIMKKIKLPL